MRKRTTPRPSPETRKKKYLMRLYVTGATTRSTRAITNLRRLCEEHLPGRYELEVIDIYQQPSLAAANQIIAAPTLVKQLPLPLRRFIGDMSDTKSLLAGLEVLASPGAGSPPPSAPAS